MTHGQVLVVSAELGGHIVADPPCHSPSVPFCDNWGTEGFLYLKGVTTLRFRQAAGLPLWQGFKREEAGLP